jgi:hypothetical protein
MGCCAAFNAAATVFPEAKAKYQEQESYIPGKTARSAIPMFLTEKPVSPMPYATHVQLYDYRGRVPPLNSPTISLHVRTAPIHYSHLPYPHI